jgi:hypothetical protein
MPEPISDEEFNAALAASVEEHMERRATTKVEVTPLGWLRWRYRFYWGRHIVHGPTRRWYDYESGVRFTRQWTLVAAARHLTKLQIKDNRKWEVLDGD